MRFAPPTPTPRGLARRVPPAVFPSIMGLFGLGLAWRRFAVITDLPPALPEALLGGVTLLYLFALAAYGLKLARRPAVLQGDIAVLPGRLGLSAALACSYLLVVALAPYLPGWVGTILVGALVVHLGLILHILPVLRLVPPPARHLKAGGHLYLTSPLVGAMAAAMTGNIAIAQGLLVVTVPVGAAIMGADLVALLRGRSPAPPLRPLLALHLSVASVAGITCGGLGYDTAATGFALLAAVLLCAFVVFGRWLTAGGFSALWSAFTFPLAATASLWLMQGGGWLWAGQGVLLVATGIVPAIAFRVMKLWAGGQLAVKTNAASA
jgi:tellurite resistance protein